MSRARQERDKQGEVVSLKSEQSEIARNAPAAGYSAMGPTDHFVQFYETDSFLINSLTGFFGIGIDIGDACIVVANSAHRERLVNSLRATGRDIDLARETEQFIALDEGEMLSQFMVDDLPDAARFYDVIGNLIERASTGGRRVRVFGEMVANLWAQKNHTGAIRLEELWNNLANRYPFSLYCAYPLRAFDSIEHGEPLFHICNGHSRVIPGESYTALYEAEDRLRAIVLLQQKAARLEEEVAEKKNALIREQLARREAEKANRLKDEFLSIVSHELRTPLNVIIGWATMLREGRLNEVAQKRAIETIENNARQQNRLVDDILDVSRAMSGQIRLNIRQFDLTAVVEEAVKSIRPAAEAKKIDLSYETSSEPVTVKGDSERLRRVFCNLLSNAVKFAPEKGRVSVILRSIENAVEVAVADTGCGIAPEFLPFIFDHFRQADGSQTRARGGLGLGLSIVRHFVELQGGTVRADSPGEGQGATFTVHLPRET
jgi:signal transduction histidine kinase